MYFLFRVIKATPPIVRKISLLSLLFGILGIELDLRLNGAKGGYINNSEKYFSNIALMPLCSLVENKIMICDSIGINKFNRSNTLHFIQPLNSDGFKSPYEFSQKFIDSVHNHRKKVLFFVGDSWTYGLNADSGYSFVSLIDRSEKYTTLNAGIPGADLPQYKAIVREYIRSGRLKPDEVVVCISRNDLHDIPNRKLTPGILIQFCTNAGGFHSYFPDRDTVVGGAKATYAYILNNYTIVGILGEKWYTSILEKSVVASRFLGWLFTSPFVHSIFSKYPALEQNHLKKNVEQKDPTDQNIQDLKDYCDFVNIPVLFILLPSKFCIGEEIAPQLKYVISLNNNVVPSSDYPSGQDDHPNNAGHYKLFVAIKKILDSSASSK